jgi:hypothetical protein
MKRLFIFAGIVLVLAGCVEEYTVIVNNESSYTVTFTMTTGYRTEEYVLNAGEQYVHYPIPVSLRHSISNEYKPKELKELIILTLSGDTYTFSDKPPSMPESE